jgi:hypothetical protein
MAMSQEEKDRAFLLLQQPVYLIDQVKRLLSQATRINCDNLFIIGNDVGIGRYDIRFPQVRIDHIPRISRNFLPDLVFH